VAYRQDNWDGANRDQLTWLANCRNPPEHPDDTPPVWVVHSGLGLIHGDQAILVVRVVEGANPTYAKVLVLKSLWGPFSPGQVLLAGAGATVGNGSLYKFKRVGDELLIFPEVTEPIVVWEGWAWPAAKSHALMAAVEKAVKEERELEDPQTDIDRAPERRRVMRTVQECYVYNREAACEGKWGGNYYVLEGIKRSELATIWGPPTCRRLTHNVEYVPPAGADCAPQEPATWSFAGPYSDAQVVCHVQDDRCIDFSWTTTTLPVGSPRP
jgi:hypothetical protein